MVSRKQSVLVDVGLDDGVCLDIHDVSATIGLDAKSEIGVGIEIPEETAEDPEAAVLVAECGVPCF